MGPTDEFKEEIRKDTSMSGTEELQNQMGKSGKGDGYAKSRHLCRKEICKILLVR